VPTNRVARYRCRQQAACKAGGEQGESVTSGVLARDLSHPALQDMALMDEYSGQA
jgi:hypothetical protein